MHSILLKVSNPLLDKESMHFYPVFTQSMKIKATISIAEAFTNPLQEAIANS
jgi:hypothetical protein